MSNFIPGNICFICPKDNDGLKFIKSYSDLIRHYNNNIPVLILRHLVYDRMAVVWSAETQSTWSIPSDCLAPTSIEDWARHRNYIIDELSGYFVNHDDTFRFVDEKGVEWEAGADDDGSPVLTRTGTTYTNRITNNSTEEKETTMTTTNTAISNISSSVKGSADIAAKAALGHVAITNLRKFIGKKHPVAAAMLSTKYGKGVEALLGAVAPALVLTYKPDSKKFMYIAESIQLSTAAAGGVELGEVVNELLEALTKGISTPFDSNE